jgi:hypothetical protein
MAEKSEWNPVARCVPPFGKHVFVTDGDEIAVGHMRPTGLWHVHAAWAHVSHWLDPKLDQLPSE